MIPPLEKIMVTLTIDAKSLIQRTANHGGYESGHCVICNRGGWLDTEHTQPNGVVHAESCPVGKAIQAYVDEHQDG
jgi:hypothetical protein